MCTNKEYISDYINTRIFVLKINVLKLLTITSNKSAIFALLRNYIFLNIIQYILNIIINI